MSTMVHVRDGLYFRSIENGCVEIIKRTSSVDSAALVWRMLLAQHEWASLVASVSVRGETAETYMAAYTLHTESQSVMEARAEAELEMQRALG